MFNHVVVVGSGVAAESTEVLAEDGRVTQRLTIPLLTTVEQCQEIADLVLTRDLGDAALEDEILILIGAGRSD